MDAATGALTPVAGSPFGTGGLSPATVGIDPTGKYLYVTNGATDNISAFSLDPVDGGPDGRCRFALRRRRHGAGLRRRGTRGAFRLRGQRGLDRLRLRHRRRRPAPSRPFPDSPFPAEGTYPRSIAFEHAGKFAYVVHSYSGTVSAFAIDAATGALAAVAGSPFAAGNGPYSVVTVRIAQ